MYTNGIISTAGITALAGPPANEKDNVDSDTGSERLRTHRYARSRVVQDAHSTDISFPHMRNFDRTHTRTQENDLLASAKRQQAYLSEELTSLLDEIDDVESDREEWKRRLRWVCTNLTNIQGCCTRWNFPSSGLAPLSFQTSQLILLCVELLCYHDNKHLLDHRFQINIHLPSREC